jgi:hypothetical protein
MLMRVADGGQMPPLLSILTSMDDVRFFGLALLHYIAAADAAKSTAPAQVTALRVLHHAMEWLDEAPSLRCALWRYGLRTFVRSDTHSGIHSPARNMHAGYSPCSPEVRRRWIEARSRHQVSLTPLQSICPQMQTPVRL